MVAALIAVVMVVCWVGYIALTVLAITGGDMARLATWAVITPVLGLLEWFGMQALERLATFG